MRRLLLVPLIFGGCGRGPAEPTAAAASPPAAAALPAGHARMLQILREIAERAPQDNIYQNDARLHALETQLAALDASASAQQRFRVLSELGEQLVLLGREREGATHLEEAQALRPALTGGVPRAFLDETALRLASAWTRVGETENCCARNAPGSCILPIEGAARHDRPEGSRNAIRVIRELLADPLATEFARRQATWLLNIASMTLGEYPDGVPEAERIPPAFFAGEEDFPRFANVAAKLGLDTFSLAGSVVAEDFDEDGDLDLVVSSFDPSGQLRFFRNEGDGTFTDRTEAAGLTGLLGGLNMVQADYDGDGHVDVLVLRGAWLGKSGRHPKSLLRNRGDGTFTDVTFDVGLGEPFFPSQTAAWTDVDGDGHLDLFVGNETSQGLDAPCQLFRNDGSGHFTDVAVAAGVTNGGFTKGVAAGDFDGDGRPDLYVSNLGQANRLYMNRGDWKFQDVAPAREVTAPRNGFPVCVLDYDNDGNLDILALPFYVTIADLAAIARGEPNEADAPHLYRGDGKGGFADVTAAAHFVRPTSVMGCNFGDLDDDGFLDVYLGTGTPMPRALMPNLMLHNRRGVDFADVTLPGGFGHLQKGHGIAFADLDGDGDLDVFEEMGGAYRGDKFRDVLYQNPGSGNHWIEVRCIGTRSNRSAIGARIRTEIVEEGKTRSVYRTVGSGGSFGCNPLRQHLGLGKAARVEVLEVFWPTTGATQTFRDVAVDQMVEITEGVDRVTPKTSGGSAGVTPSGR